MTAWCGLDIVGVRRREREWLRQALRDVGVPVSGWSGTCFRKGAPGVSYTVRGHGRDVKKVIEDLWENERPGYPIEVHIIHG